MATKIEWSEKVWEVTGGCTKCASGCKNCWALNNVWRMAHNPIFGKNNQWKGLVEKKNGVLNWTGKIKLFNDALDIPLKRHKSTTYFIDSKADLFHPKVPWEFVDDIFTTIFKAQQHFYQILTKRAKGMFEYFTAIQDGWIDFGENRDLPPSFVGLGVSISTQKEADEKIPILLKIPAAVRFVSIEPMLEKINGLHIGKCGYYCDERVGHVDHTYLDWVIVGAESKGRGIGRPCKAEWIDSIVGQCKAANVPVFVKQIHKDDKLVKMPKEYPQEYPKEIANDRHKNNRTFYKCLRRASRPFVYVL